MNRRRPSISDTIKDETFAKTLLLPSAQIYKPTPVVFMEPTVNIRQSEFDTLFDMGVGGKFSWLCLGVLITHILQMMWRHLANEQNSALHWQQLSVLLAAVVASFILEPKFRRKFEEFVDRKRYRLKQDLLARFSHIGEFAQIDHHAVTKDDQRK